MKIKRDYITNSSSTSFILGFHDEFEEEKFLKAIGIENDSLFINFFEDFFYSLKRELIPARDFYKNHRHYYKYTTFEDFIINEFSENELEKIIEMEEQGKKLFMGELSSSESMMEIMFCCDSIYIDSDEIYFNGKENAW